MNDFLELGMRMSARRGGAALPLRACSEIAPDRGDAFGYAPIRVVSEERIQGAAFGFVDAKPMLVREALPMGRATAFLEPLADALDSYLRGAIAGRYARIYVPHHQAAEALWLLGERYESNPEASDKVRRLGFISRVLAEIIRFPGQQIVVSLGETLAKHVVSGGNKTHDLHLRYLMTWVGSTLGPATHDAAERAALLPAAAMLTREDDDRVERLRRDLKRNNGDPRLRSTIDRILDVNALSEWQLIVDARAAFRGFDLKAPSQLQSLYDQNLDWLARQLESGHAAPSRTFAMCDLLEEHSLAFDDHRTALIGADDRMFEMERDTGRSAYFEVVSVDRIGVGRNVAPVHVRGRVDQGILRLRRNAGVSFVDSKLTGTVLDLSRSTPDGPYEVVIDVTNQLRSATRLTPGTRLKMLEGQRVDMRFQKRKVFAAARDIARPILTQDTLPDAPGRVRPEVDLKAILVTLERTS